VLALPEDMLSDTADVADIPAVAPGPGGVAAEAVAAVEAALAAAERPLVVAGGGLWTAEAASDLARFAAARRLPVAVPFRRQDYLDNRLPAYVGDLGVGMNPRLGQRLKTADLLLVLGSRLGDIATGSYEILDPAGPARRRECRPRRPCPRACPRAAPAPPGRAGQTSRHGTPG
jgi:acetolactate synthase I/II/III large subunit